jgi:hypothetical protein
MMDTREVALAFTALLREAGGMGAGEAFRHEDVSSIEAAGEPRAVHGVEPVRGKAGWRLAQHEVHALEVQGPYVNEDQFALHLRVDVTVKATGRRMAARRSALHSVQDGKALEERFFY